MLNTCNKPCGPADFYPGGYCDKNGCLDKKPPKLYLIRGESFTGKTSLAHKMTAHPFNAIPIELATTAALLALEIPKGKNLVVDWNQIPATQPVLDLQQLAAKFDIIQIKLIRFQP